VKPWQECEETEDYQIYMDVIREEKAWAQYLFKKKPLARIGLNANILARLHGLYCGGRIETDWYKISKSFADESSRTGSRNMLHLTNK